MGRLSPDAKGIFYMLLIIPPVVYVLIFGTIDLPCGALISHYLYRWAHGIGICLYAFVPLIGAVLTWDRYLLQQEMHDYEAQTWEDDSVSDSEAEFESESDPGPETGMSNLDLYEPELHMYKIYERAFEDYLGPPSPFNSWERIAQDLRLQARSRRIYFEEVEKLDDFLIWKESRVEEWRRETCASPGEPESANWMEEEGLPTWLQGRGIANLKILWKTLEVRAKTLGFMAMYARTLDDREDNNIQIMENEEVISIQSIEEKEEEQGEQEEEAEEAEKEEYTQSIDSGKRSKGRVLVVESICAEYRSVKEHMESFRSKGWSNWLGENDIDRHTLVMCNSLRCAEGVWEMLEDYDFQRAMNPWWAKWKDFLVWMDGIGRD
ncbi:hypothetical protein VTL71DRAFT_14865 [Oculimacula yallundae]|uniref:Uncharacterized protein n=1 Tax=Oculimacula yallundae TaxID=86028 RepID=A0ABR4CH68_9HELO